MDGRHVELGQMGSAATGRQESSQEPAPASKRASTHVSLLGFAPDEVWLLWTLKPSDRRCQTIRRMLPASEGRHAPTAGGCA
jgi:hypothetical protein